MAIYNPEVVQQYMNETLDTMFNAAGWCEVDNSLTSKEGDTVTIWRYSGSGAPEDVSEFEGNTGYSDIDGESYEYKSVMTQARCRVSDEETYRNSWAVDKKINLLADQLFNDANAKCFKEWYATTNLFEVTSADGIPTFAEFVTAQSELNVGVDQGFQGGGESYKYFISPKDWRLFQVQLASENVIIASELINGVRKPSVNGVPVEVSDKVIDGASFFATNKAVRLLLAKSVGAETARDANLRVTEYYVRHNLCPYLEFIDKVVVLGKKVAITKTAPSHGSFNVQAYGIKGATVKLQNVAPASGYQVGTLTVTASDRSTVIVDQNHLEFRMPESGAAVEVALSFEAI